jgi:FKBP-type peptidyl-prolyl cis-trans isomerase FklB
MMNKTISLTVLLLALSLASCEETVEIGAYDNWQERNEAFIDSLQQVYDTNSDQSLNYITDEYDKEQKIFFKKLTSVPTGQTPLYTDSVRVFYRGTLINDVVFDKNFSGADPSVTDAPTDFNVNALISGWTWALQYMKVGERWMLYIPWKSGYGSAGTTGILGYSTLIFDVRLEKILQKKK